MPTPEAFDQSQHLIDGPAPAWTAAAAATINAECRKTPRPNPFPVGPSPAARRE